MTHTATCISAASLNVLNPTIGGAYGSVEGMASSEELGHAPALSILSSLLPLEKGCQLTKHLLLLHLHNHLFPNLPPS